MSTASKIESNIYSVIASSNIPVSTREISLKIKKAWHTVDRHCLKLELAGKIKGMRIGNINAWVINK